jgi:hypothetical protein
VFFAVSLLRGRPSGCFSLLCSKVVLVAQARGTVGIDARVSSLVNQNNLGKSFFEEELLRLACVCAICYGG